ncbi:hypothetical protein AAG570_009677 [Ranatra chinensis]|uniref:Major facilitator superfamily (MFS) profile domain-containing protein n=1 Tax=Ranatra chinensis TaxID=642074 RepID=A0ABD0Z0K9_9HEMI
MVTAVFIGNMVSPIPGGYIMDAIGRKWTLFLFCLASISSWVIVVFTHSAVGLYVARVLAGMWTGIVYTVVPVYMGEVMEPNMRGAASSVIASFLFVGFMYETVLGPLISYQTLALLCCLPTVLLLFALACIPESPYYFLMKGKRDDAVDALVWLRGRPDVEEDVRRMEDAVRQQLENPGSFLDILATNASRKAFAIVALLGMVQRSSGLTLLFTYATVIIPDSFISASMSSIILNIVWLIVCVVGVRCLDIYGRKLMFLVSCAGAFLSVLLVCIWFYLRDITKADVSSSSWVPFFGLLLHGIVYPLGLVSVPTTVQGELLAVNVKGKASAITSIIMAMMSGIVVLIYLPVNDAIGLYFNFAVCLISTFSGAVFALFFMIETKGKTLEEIQVILGGKISDKANGTL